MSTQTTTLRTDALPGGGQSSAPAPAPRTTAGFLRRHWAWTAMLTPALALLVWLIGYPFIEAIVLSFKHVVIGQPGTWLGWKNYSQAFADSEFLGSMLRTIVFTVCAVALEVVLGWAIALLLFDRYRRVGSVIRTVFAIPMLLSPVVIAAVWRVLLNPQYGWVPAALHNSSLALLSDTKTALPTMILVDAWEWTPFIFLIVAAGLNAIPGDAVEAAKIDGAGFWKLLRHIYWPLGLPVTVIAILFRSLDAFKTFDLAYNLTGGGPGSSTETLGIYIYKQAFTNYDQGYAAALSLLTTVLMTAFSIALLAWLRQAERRAG